MAHFQARHDAMFQVKGSWKIHLIFGNTSESKSLNQLENPRLSWFSMCVRLPSFPPNLPSLLNHGKSNSIEIRYFEWLNSSFHILSEEGLSRNGVNVETTGLVSM